MKHAYLICAHNEFSILEKLIKLLDDERNDIYIHIDKKVKNFDFNKFKKITKKSNVYFTERIKVYWGTNSQIACELILLETALKKGEYKYYHLLSGVCMPLKNQNYIHEFFDKNNGYEFVDYRIKGPIDGQTLEKVKYYHLFKKYLRSNNVVVSRLSDFLYRVCIKLQKILKIDRTKGKEYMYGSNWFSITDELAKYVVDNKEDILKEYKYTNCADEIFLQTLVYYSEFKKRVYVDKKNEYNQNLRLVDWKRGNPYTFQEQDFNELKKSKQFFARKFSTKDKIVERIYESLR